MAKRIDLTGQQFGELTVLEYVGDKYWKCRCSCGNIVNVHGYDLRSGKKKTCGHDSKTKFKNITGQKIGEWTVLEYKGNGKWKCRCSCGEVRDVSSINLLNGRTKSCGHNTNKFKDLTGMVFGEWEVIEYVGDGKWKCRCSCGEEGVVDRRLLLSGRSTSCGHNTTKFKDLTGMKFGELTVLEYIGDSKWRCQCSCGEIIEVYGYSLRSGISKSCGHNTNKFKDLTGMKFGELTVLEYVGNGKWRCKCSCGIEKEFSGYKLRSGQVKSCGHLTDNKDLIGKRFGEWEVIDTLKNPNVICKCSCGTIKTLNKYDLIHGRTKSCGHKMDLSGQKFGEWEVLEHTEGRYWRCKCSCGTIKDVHEYSLTYGLSKSCGCKSSSLAVETNLEKYGVLYHTQHHRTQEQILMTLSKENLLNAITSNFEYKPTPLELANLVGLTPHRILTIIHSFELEHMVDFNRNVSKYEDDIHELFPCSSRSNRDILNGKELDLYYKDKNFAIEFNGTFWHSSLNKDRKYHQDKTLLCAQKGIRLFHIFEYEWLDDIKREKIIKLLSKILDDDASIRTIYGRDTIVSEITNEEAIEFCNKYHLQNGINASINLGLKFRDELIGVMTFSKPRFNKDYEWELMRLAFKDDVKVLGGSEKLFNYFKHKYNPKSIVSYCDISKFSGRVYKKLGFSATINDITEPNYVWVNPLTNHVLTRYQTQKYKLIENNLGDKGQTEDEIMANLGYLKVYDSGNIRFKWVREN